MPRNRTKKRPLASLVEAALAPPSVDVKQAVFQQTCPICHPKLTQTEAVDRAHGFLRRVAATLTEKNAKYGDSAANPMRVFSRASAVEQLRVRVDDKLSRLARGDESMLEDEDVLLDLVGYLALYAGQLERKAEIDRAKVEWGKEVHGVVGTATHELEKLRASSCYGKVRP